MLNPLEGHGEAFAVAESRVGPVHVMRVEGPVDMRGVVVLGRRLLAMLNDGARRLLVDLSDAEPLASGALLSMLLRLDRYAARREARLVVISGDGTERMFEIGNPHGHVTIAATRREADVLLSR